MNRVTRQISMGLLASVLFSAGTAAAQTSPQPAVQGSQAQERERLEYERQMQEAQTVQERERIRNEYESRMQVQSNGQHGATSSGKPTSKSGTGGGGAGGRKR